MKHLTNSLLIVSLCFSLLTSCEVDAPAKANIEDSIENKSVENPSTSENIKNINEAPVVQQQNSPFKHIGADMKRNTKSDEQQSSSDMRKRYEDNMSTPTTADQIKVADKICACLNEQTLFDKMKKVSTKQDVFTIAGYDNDEQVKPMQDCYNKNMIPAVKNLGKKAGIFSMKSRNYLNKKCLNGTNNFWISIGGYIGRNEDKEAIRLDNY